ncbi:MAG TPA: DUF4342 domain-containing protein [Candidatus Korarchaeota archaeon]|nr:DUF4342 domain-containing protein [Candidatus Korarchaeota archaeon]
MKRCFRCGKNIEEDMNYCPYCGEPLRKVSKEEFSVSTDDLVRKVKELIHEGNITRIIVKNEEGKTLLEIPATVGVIGALLSPWMAALGVITAIATRCTIVVERREE